MPHPLTRPRWIAGHLLVVVTVVAFVGAGFWQLRRHAEVSDLRDAVALAQALPPVGVEDAEMYRRVVAVGWYDEEATVRVLRSREGESGYAVLAPLVLDDGNAVLVYRYWVPLAFDGVPGGLPFEITVSGILWPPEPGSWHPAGFESGMVVRRIDPAVVAPFTDYEFLEGYVVASDESPHGDAPWIYAPEPPTVSLGPHLAYAVQWLLFTLIVLAGYPFLLRRAARRG